MGRGRFGKLLRKKGNGSTLLPRAVMSFWTILSCCFSTKATREDTLRPRGREGKGRGTTGKFDIHTVMCYNCRKRGHFQRNCPEPQMRPRYSRGRGGLFLRGTFMSSVPTRRGNMRAPFGRDRATFHVEEDEPEEQYRWQDEAWAGDNSGNY